MIIRERKFENEYFDPALSGSDTQTFLHGSIMNKTKATYVVDIRYEAQSSYGELFTVDNNGTLITRSQGSFYSDGFTSGMTVELFSNLASAPSITEDRTVLSVTDTSIVLTTPTTIPDGNFVTNTSTTDSLRLRNKTPLTALQMRWDVSGNFEAPNYLSNIDDTQLGYYSEVITSSFTPMTRNGSVNGNQTGYANVRSLGFVDGSGNITATPTTIQRFEVEHCFNILPFALEENREDFINGIAPDYLEDDESLKYGVSFNFKTTIIDPNQQKTLSDENTLGSVAWFGENFNSLNNEFTLDSIAYSNDNQLEYGTSNTVTAVISTIGDDFTTDNVGIYVSYLPNQDDYSNNTEQFADIWSFDSVVDAIGNTASGLIGSIKGYTITQLAPKQIEVVFEVDFDNDLIKEDDYYVIAFDVASGGNVSGTSNKVLLKGDINQFYINTDIDGLLEWKDLQFYSHTTPITEVDSFVITDAFSDFKGYVEDGAVVQFGLCLNREQITDNFGLIENVQVKTIAYNSTTGNTFELDYFSYDLSNQVVVDGVQQINIDTSRGYSLNDVDEFNNVVLKNTNEDRLFVEYFGNLGIKFLWQDWVALAGADTVFYDNSEQQNGLNKNASNYSLKEGYDIRVRICTDILKDGVITTYVQQSPTLEVCDYDEHDGWTYEIKTFDENGIDLQGKISTTGLTTICGTATDGTPYALSDLYGIMRIESSGQTQPYEILESSTLRGVDGAFIPTALDGINTLLEETTPNNYKVTALIDGSNLGTNNKISFRFGCKNIPLPPPQRFSTIDDSDLGNIQFTYNGSIDSFGNTITDFTNFTNITRWYFEDAVRELDTSGNTLSRTVNFSTSEYVEITQIGTSISFDWSNMPTVNDLTDIANIESWFVPFNGGFTFDKRDISDVLMGQYGVGFQGSQQYYELLGFPKNDVYNAHYDVTIPFREAAEFVFTSATIQQGSIISAVNVDELIAEKGIRRQEVVSIGSSFGFQATSSDSIRISVVTRTHPTQYYPYQEQPVWISDAPSIPLNYDVIGIADSGTVNWNNNGLENSNTETNFIAASGLMAGTYQVKLDALDIFGNYMEDVNVFEVPGFNTLSNGSLQVGIEDTGSNSFGLSMQHRHRVNYQNKNTREFEKDETGGVTYFYDSDNNLITTVNIASGDSYFYPKKMTISNRSISRVTIPIIDTGSTIPDAPYDKTGVAAENTHNIYILQTF